MISFSILNRAPNKLELMQSQPLWIPFYPRETSKILLKQQSLSYQTFNPIRNMGFGGIRGERLPHLTRIVAHIFKDPAFIVELIFYFDDQGHIRFGRQGLTKISSFIKDLLGREYQVLLMSELPRRVKLFLFRYVSLCRSQGTVFKMTNS